MRMIYGVVFFPFYIAWILYHVFIKKDMKKHITDFYALTFFMGVWVALYYFIFF